MDAIPHSKIAPSFLDSNAQAHHDILFAVADVLDNAREAGSTLVNIDVRSKGNPTRPTHQLVISDDGAGMCEAQMSEGVMSIAYTQKDLSTGQHYGMGSTTAVPRLCRGALCFSLTRNSHPTLGLLSSRLSAKLGATELVVPQVSWSALEPGAILEDAPRAGGPSKEPRTVSLTREARAASLKVILAHSPYSTEEQLIAEFRSIEAASATGTGTRWLMWDVDTHELELAKAADDVLVKNKQELWPHQRSLRGFLEVLYYVDDELLRRGAMMSIRIKGTPVTPRNWTTFLHHAQTVRHRPHNATTALAQATTRFGFQKPLAEVARLFGARSAGKNKHGSEYTAHTFTEDDVHFFTFGLTRVSYQKTHDYSGVFYYHKNRLTIALAPAALQKRGFTQMNTTEVRIQKMGRGTIACCNENFLTQAHNKAEYVPLPHSPYRYELLASRVNSHMDKYLSDYVAPQLAYVTGRAPAPPDVGDDEYERPVSAGRPAAGDDEDDEEGGVGPSSGLATTGTPLAQIEDGDRGHVFRFVSFHANAAK